MLKYLRANRAAFVENLKKFSPPRHRPQLVRLLQKLKLKNAMIGLKKLRLIDVEVDKMQKKKKAPKKRKGELIKEINKPFYEVGSKVKYFQSFFEKNREANLSIAPSFNRLLVFYGGYCKLDQALSAAEETSEEPRSRFLENLSRRYSPSSLQNYHHHFFNTIRGDRVLRRSGFFPVGSAQRNLLKTIIREYDKKRFVFFLNQGGDTTRVSISSADDPFFRSIPPHLRRNLQLLYFIFSMERKFQKNYPLLLESVLGQQLFADFGLSFPLLTKLVVFIKFLAQRRCYNFLETHVSAFGMREIVEGYLRGVPRSLHSREFSQFLSLLQNQPFVNFKDYFFDQFLRPINFFAKIEDAEMAVRARTNSKKQARREEGWEQFVGVLGRQKVGTTQLQNWDAIL